MCGVVGLRRLDGAPVGQRELRVMAGQLAHRGPDDDGFWAEGAVGLGHRRLSIIDVGGSAQPMTSADGTLRLCFNGEIFNYNDLRRGSNYPFRTTGDTETLLALFQERGIDAVHELRGQFAFAMHDGERDETWLVRDRLGVLPMYWYFDGPLFAFASEIKALLAVLPDPPAVDEASVADYLLQRAVPAPHTLFRGIHKLPAGHRLRLTADGRVDVAPYWSLAALPGTEPTPPAAAVDLVEAALRSAVGAALVADVPVGSYLSGGVDSSLIVALMAERGQQVETFAAGFGPPGRDELPYARLVSQALGTKHHEVVVRADDFTSLWPLLSWHRDAPISEPADVAVFRLAQTAREHVKVVLSGEGSDELFGGYPKHRYAGLTASNRLGPSALRGPALRLAERRLPARLGRARIALRALSAASPEERMEAWFSPFLRREVVSLLGGVAPRPLAPLASTDPLRAMLMRDCSSWLPDNLLERGDRMSMAASLELRPPFLDHRVVELAFRLPSDVKVRGRVGKWVVKEVARRHLPAEIVDRRKVGFRVPLDDWFRGGLESLSWDLLLSADSFVLGLAGRQPLLEMLTAHRTGRRNEEMRIWTLLSLEVWHRSCVRDGATGAPPLVGAGPVRGGAE